MTRPTPTNSQFIHDLRERALVEDNSTTATYLRVAADRLQAQINYNNRLVARMERAQEKLQPIVTALGKTNP